jgi:hypothetical protein
MLNDRVIPCYKENGASSCYVRILTDRGTEYCGNRETHELKTTWPSMTLYLKQYDRISAGEAGYGRSIDLGSNKTAGKGGRHTRISNKARTVDGVSQTRMMQGRAKREKRLMTEEAVCVGVDVAKNTLDMAVSNSKETRQFDNDHEGIARCGLLHRWSETCQDYS